MYKHYYKVILALFVCSNILASEVIQRESDLENNSNISDIPYSFHLDKLEKSNLIMFADKDLSAYGGMKLFSGYGFSDKDEKNCYFVNLDENQNILNDFQDPFIYNKKSYLLSRSRMSYNSCKVLTNKYGGYVYSPLSSSLDFEVKKHYKEFDYWVGISKENCSQDWKNDYDLTQSYNRVDSDACMPDKLNIFSLSSSYAWELESESSNHYCMLQIDSEDIFRPIKVCAPWWQIEQSYFIDCTERNNNLLPFYNMDVPKTYSVCVDLAGDEIIDYEELYNNKDNWNTYTCVSYYSTKAGDSCLENPQQEQCFVNECSGSVEKTCELQGTFSSDIKDYEIGAVVDATGNIVKKKVKENIKTYEYLCPPSRPSIANCEEYKEVNLFPTDACNPGGCDNYFDCLNNHPNNTDACDDLKPSCEKKYGNSFMVDYETKEVLYAIVKCNNGDIVHNENIQVYSQSKHRCKEYSIEETFEEKEESCVADATKRIRSVDVSLSDSDIYQNDDTCIRINNSFESSPTNNYYLEFNTSLNFQTKISKITTITDDSDVNSSNLEKIVVQTLEDGNFSVSTYKGDSVTVDEVGDLSSAFASVKEMVIGDDNETLNLLNTRKVENNVVASEPEVVQYDYFSDEWIKKRIFAFEDDSLVSIIRPYSTFAQCLDLPLDSTKSSYANPFPKYLDGTPKVSPDVIREDYESSAFMEVSDDSDINTYGHYCKKIGSNYVDWYGTDSNDLYYAKYECSQFYGSDGEVWPQQTTKTISFGTIPSIDPVDGSSVKHIAYNYGAYDFMKGVFYSYDECKDKTGLECQKFSYATTVISMESLYALAFKNSTFCSFSSYDTTYSFSAASADEVFLDIKKSIFGINSLSAYETFYLYRYKVGEYLIELSEDDIYDGYSYLPDDGDPVTYVLVGRTTVYTPTGYYRYDNSSFKTFVDGNYIYDISSDMFLKYDFLSGYEYTCPSGFSPKYKGFTGNNIDDFFDPESFEDPNDEELNPEIFYLNSSRPPKNNCISDSFDLQIPTDVESYFQDNMEIDGVSCVKSSDIYLDLDNLTYKADYNCSKYYDEDGNLDLDIQYYYLYQSDKYKYFRKKTCGYGDLNSNDISKSGDNAVMFNTNSSSFVDDISGLEIYDDLSTDYKSENTSRYKIYPEKDTISGVSNSTSYAFVDKSLTSMDSIFELYRHDGLIRLISLDQMSDSRCSDYKSDLEKSQYKVEYKIDNNKCIIDFDYFNGIPEINTTDPIVVNNFKSGSFDFNQTGYNEILVIQSYIDGEWGYISNHFSKPFEDNNIKIDRKEIYPIKDVAKDFLTSAKLTFSRKIDQKGTISRKRILMSPGELSEKYFLVNSSTARIVDLGFADITAVTYIVNLFGGKRRYIDVTRNESLSLNLNNYRYFPNIYGYDFRDIDLEHKTSEYWRISSKSGTREKGAGINFEKESAQKIKNLLVYQYNLDETEYDDSLEGADSNYISGFPDLHWWQNGPKRRLRTYSYSDDISKNYNLVFIGATNQVSLFVPFKGDYEVMALDSSMNILAKRVVYSENYIESEGTQPYQQIFFSLDNNFDLASGIKDGNTTNACRYSSVAEWGGGVSGAYYSFGTPKGYTCSKSNDGFVKQHAAKYIAIRPLGSEKYSIVTLKNPMPFANRIFIVSLSKLQHREYACFSENSCSVE